MKCINNLSNTVYYYRPQRSWGKVIFSQASMILFTGGVCLSACWDTTPRTRQASLPREQSILGDTVNGRVVCILLECNLVILMFSKKFQNIYRNDLELTWSLLAV